MNQRIQKILRPFHLEFKKPDPEERFYLSLFGKYRAFTMVPEALYVDNLKLCREYSSEGGAVVECGVWKGGMLAGIAEVLGDKKYVYYAYDSFEGLPDVKEIDGRKALEWQKNTSSPIYYDNCRAEQESVEGLLSALGVEYKAIKGWFDQTVGSNPPGEAVTVLRLDGDWYESTMVCLENLYPLVKEGGLVIIDDYFAWDGCSRALHDYLSRIRSTSRIRQSPAGLAYLVKSEAPRERA